MKTEAVVNSIDEDCIELSYVRNSACGHCKNRDSCMDAESKVEKITVRKECSGISDLKKGQKVILEVQTTLSPILLIIIMYGIPVFFFATGIITTSYFIKDEIIQLGTGVISLFLGLLLVKSLQSCIMRKNVIQYRLERLDESIES